MINILLILGLMLIAVIFITWVSYKEETKSVKCLVSFVWALWFAALICAVKIVI